MHYFDTTAVGERRGGRALSGCNRLIWRQIPLDRETKTALLKLMV